jgi:tRNA/tmRNA/rRNA uracil-C5-methylase (TrmA/RlmC/RlmD family)
VVIHRVATAGPRVITYVACDPAGFARDVANLATHGFGLTHVLAFDAFPMTHHLECVGRFIPAG